MAWLGATGFYTDMVFRVPKGTVVALADKAKAAKMGYVGDYTRLGNSCWFKISTMGAGIGRCSL